MLRCTDLSLLNEPYSIKPHTPNIFRLQLVVLHRPPPGRVDTTEATMQ